MLEQIVLPTHSYTKVCSNIFPFNFVEAVSEYLLMIGKEHKHRSLETIQLTEHKYFLTKVLPKTDLADKNLTKHIAYSACCGYLWRSSSQILLSHHTFLWLSLPCPLAQKRLFYFVHMTKRTVDH